MVRFGVTIISFNTVRIVYQQAIKAVIIRRLDDPRGALADRFGIDA